jgi:hypothetical protein
LPSDQRRIEGVPDSLFCGAGNLARSRLLSRLDPLESGSTGVSTFSH